MAEQKYTHNEYTPQETTRSTGNLTISQLRDLAQEHLRTIDAELGAEAQAQILSQAEVQKYTKMKRKDRTRSGSPFQAALTSDASIASTAAGYPGNAEMTKGPKLRSAGDVLDRLKWDPSVKMEEYFIGYLERFDGILEMPAVNWIKESTDEDFIPQHRIRWVKRRTSAGEETVWDRELRIDRLFGSGTPAATGIVPTDLESVADSVDGGVHV